MIVACKLYLFHRNRRSGLQIGIAPIKNRNENNGPHAVTWDYTTPDTSTNNRINVQVIDKGSAILKQLNSKCHSFKYIPQSHYPFHNKASNRFRSRVRPISNKPTISINSGQSLDLNYGEGTSRNNRNDINRPMPQYSRTARRRMGSQKQMAHVALMLLSACFFMACYTPYCLTTCLYVFCPDHCGVDANTIKASATFAIFHALFSVIVYLVKDKNFRKALCQRIT